MRDKGKGRMEGVRDGRVEGGKVSVYFFFQAEDGIRDRLVTGVQTCALPICFADLSRKNIFQFITLSQSRAMKQPLVSTSRRMKDRKSVV